jgi:hypothetical protein
MIDLESILAEWKEDSEISKHQLDETSRVTPALHSKYLEYHALTKLRLKKAEFAQKSLLKDKWLYYNGKMDEDTLKTKGWHPDPFNGLKVLKGEMEHYYDSDPEIQESEMKIQYLKTIVETLEQIISNLTWRHQTIGNMIRWRQFEAGS